MNFYTLFTSLLLIIASFILLPIFKGFQFILLNLWRGISWTVMTFFAIIIGLVFQYRKLKANFITQKTVNVLVKQ